MKLVVDTSAITAVLLEEPEAKAFAELIMENEVIVSAATVIEAIRVIGGRRGIAHSETVPEFLQAFGIEIASVTEAQVWLAEEGMQRFGKGRAHPPAVLNVGDLFAYALARHLDAPLLFKGDDFSQTDVRPALAV